MKWRQREGNHLKHIRGQGVKETDGLWIILNLQVFILFLSSTFAPIRVDWGSPSPWETINHIHQKSSWRWINIFNTIYTLNVPACLCFFNVPACTFLLSLFFNWLYLRLYFKCSISPHLLISAWVYLLKSCCYFKTNFCLLFSSARWNRKCGPSSCIKQHQLSPLCVLLEKTCLTERLYNNIVFVCVLSLYVYSCVLHGMRDEWIFLFAY